MKTDEAKKLKFEEHKEILTRAVTKAMANGWDIVGEAMRVYCPACDSQPKDKRNIYLSPKDKFCSDHGVGIQERMTPGEWRFEQYGERYINGDEHICFSYHTGDWSSDDHRSGEVPAYELIVNHDFARALWGDAVLTNEQVRLQSLWSGYDEYPNFDGEPWQYHLQQLVLSDDPIKYLGDNIQ
jgi:hypothetical protein